VLARHDVSVLVVDDHPAIRRSLRKLLHDSGVQVVGEAGDGEEAVRLCERLHPDIVVLDIAMPVLNGFEAAQQIAEGCPDTKIIFLTAHALEEFAKEAFRLGGVGFVAKKQAATGLPAAIEAALQGKTYDSRKSAA
jgi:DNA-binding NarL/FixJ family response regulator